MGFTKEQLLARFKELQIDFLQYEHPAVMTAAEQEKYVGDKGGGLSVNLFLKDKKSRFYIVSSLLGTKVDLKVLSQRLGLGKGGIRMAPEEALSEILQVSLGSVTPLAVVNESARYVEIQIEEEHCFFHPLSNDMSIALKSCDLNKFLKSIGREASYVDLEANPTVGKDQPPDLAALVPSGSIVLPDGPGKASPSPLQAPAENNITMDKKATTVAVKTSKPHGAAQNQKEKPADVVHQPSIFSDAGLLTEAVVEKTSTLLLSEITEDTIKQHGESLGTVVAEKMRKRLTSDLSSILMLFKNSAYTEGFHAGVDSRSP
ncbi:hypothetical protein Tsubulata_008976 [Turnera subulata]|uniref:YbaK/aminoacyl-tRNA synthetase-associated domain-containing protein n=1 Tax=Turnera subulata TaxID=218843 RepID=A0A9Q0JB42_9ROSI|nr:hypothetical protein Tsubulata_008976 [Turnera subulata]